MSTHTITVNNSITSSEELLANYKSIIADASPSQNLKFRFNEEPWVSWETLSIPEKKQIAIPISKEIAKIFGGHFSVFTFLNFEAGKQVLEIRVSEKLVYRPIL